jgi:HSP20 family molecular chaperone IbpA
MPLFDKMARYPAGRLKARAPCETQVRLPIGNYSRSFQLSSKIEQDGITAELKDGVMTLVLPKAEKAKPRRINLR